MTSPNYMNLWKLNHWLRPCLAVPDHVFVRRLNKLKFPDEKLEVHFNRITKMWEIWRISDDGGYKPCLLLTMKRLDNRGLLEFKKRFWVHSNRSVSDLCHELDQKDELRKMRLSKNNYDQIDSITRDRVDGFRGVPKKQVPLEYGVLK